MMIIPCRLKLIVSWIDVERIRSNRRNEITALKGCKDVLNTLSEHFQRRLFVHPSVPLILSYEHPLVYTPQDIGSHVGIEHPQAVARRTRLFNVHGAPRHILSYRGNWLPYTAA